MRHLPRVLAGFAVLLASARGSEQGVPVGKPSWTGELVAGSDANVGGRAPLALTASDGTGLRLSSLTVHAALEDPLALTEMQLVFENPQDRVLEGNFKIMLPAGASLSRFAMKTDAGWQEGEVVETQAARRAYEDFLHRRQDPALLEQAPGNEFSARVFPIGPRASKELIVTYSQTLEGGAPYTLPLEGLPRLGRLDVQVHAGEGAPVVLEQRADFVPGGDLVVRRNDFARAAGVRAGKYVMVRAVPVLDSTPDPLGSCVVLLDTSASRALGLREQTELVAGLIASLPERSRVAVLAFDQTAALIFDGDKSAFGAAEVERVVARGALGASNLAAAFDAVRALVDQQPAGPARRLLLVSDGVATAGETDPNKLAGHLENLQGSAIGRVDAIVLGGLRDEPALQAIVRGNLRRDGVVVDAQLGVAALRAKLDRATRSRIPVQIEGATWSYPTQLDGIQPGDEVRIYAEVPIGTVPKVSIGDAAPVVPELAAVSLPLLERAWAGAKIRSVLEAPPQGDAERGRRAVIELSRRHRVISPHTSMLVLESDDDYRRVDIDRRSKLDILTVADGRVAVARRSRQPPDDEGRPGQNQQALGASDPDIPIAPWGRQDRTTARWDRAPNPRVLREAAEFGMIGLLNAAASGADGPSAAVAAQGNTWDGNDAADAFGAGFDFAGEKHAESRGPYTGMFAEVMSDLADPTKTRRALAQAEQWQRRAPGDVMALVALGEAQEAAGDPVQAARAYGSILELFAFRADSRRFAGERLARLGTPLAFELATDAFRGAVRQRPDHPSSHRLLAYSLFRQGHPAEAFAALEAGMKRRVPTDRFAGVARILEEDLALLGLAWIKAEPARRGEIEERLGAASISLDAEREPSVRFVLSWETDANDVDFHIRDGRGGHAFYGRRKLPSGGALYADVTNGYGPECFTVRGPKQRRAYPYTLSAHYYARGPMGHGMGTLQIIEHDGNGGLRFEERPFVIMQDRAFVDLGSVKAG